MKHSFNSITRCNKIYEALFEANNSVCYTPKTEPRVQSYDTMNMARKYADLEDFGVNLVQI